METGFPEAANNVKVTGWDKFLQNRDIIYSQAIELMLP
jgi:hypothetical protein